MYGYIYLICNIVNNKIYVGQHKYSNPELDPKYEGSGIILQEAYKKYGKSNFKTFYICSANSKESLDELEKFYIRKYREELGRENVYNLADGRQGGDIYPMTQERRNKISKALTGRKIDPEIVKRRANTQRGRKVSEESKQKSRISNLGQKRSEEYKKKMSKNHANVNGPNNPFFGKKHCEESLAKISAAAKGRNSNKRWINNGTKSLLIDISKISSYLEAGYTYGRAKLNRSSTTIPKKEVDTK